MRLAARKTDGAWYRTNKYLREHAAGVAELQALLTADERVTAMADAYAEIINQTGVVSDTAETFIGAWCQNGIPREVWYGYSRFDSLSKPEGKDYYMRVHAKLIRNGGYALREIITNWRKAQEMLSDLINVDRQEQGNPGGRADARKDLTGA